MKTLDLFDYVREQKKEKESPLASRLRPVTLEEVVGQRHIIGKDKLLYRAIKADKLSSVLFYGEDDACKSHRKYDQCGIYPDQCDFRREKRYGRSGQEGERAAGYVW